VKGSGLGPDQLQRGGAERERGSGQFAVKRDRRREYCFREGGNLRRATEQGRKARGEK
jgi:hypothetical protein